MNLMQMIQCGGNPKMILSQMMSNSQFSNNPIMKNTFDMPTFPWCPTLGKDVKNGRN